MSLATLLKNLIGQGPDDLKTAAPHEVSEEELEAIAGAGNQAVIKVILERLQELAPEHIMIDGDHEAIEKNAGVVITAIKFDDSLAIQFDIKRSVGYYDEEDLHIYAIGLMAETRGKALTFFESLGFKVINHGVDATGNFDVPEIPEDSAGLRIGGFLGRDIRFNIGYFHSSTSNVLSVIEITEQAKLAERDARNAKTEELSLGLV